VANHSSAAASGKQGPFTAVFTACPAAAAADGADACAAGFGGDKQDTETMQHVCEGYGRTLPFLLLRCLCY
jgi:hypothetical protein